jgi:hypothetical protein
VAAMRDSDMKFLPGTGRGTLGSMVAAGRER